MLIAAAAERWKVTPEQCRTEQSVVHGPDGQSAPYAALAGEAAHKPIPASVSTQGPVGISAGREARSDASTADPSVTAR